MPNVAYVREELKALLPQYELIRDVLEGEPKIKKAGDKYLPRPNPEDTSTENKARYKAYRDRAVFYNVTQRTLSGLVGQVFMRDPVVEVPSALDIIVADCDGSGTTLTQSAKHTTRMVLAYNRAAVFIDYPEAPVEGVSRAELQTGKYRPTIKSVEPVDVGNWRQEARGAKNILTLAVVKEKFKSHDDGFEVKYDVQYRELRIENDTYIVRIWQRQPNATFTVTGMYVPKDASGKPFNEIPLKLIDANKNDVDPQTPFMYDLATLNVGHYRNSADYEESVFVVGQPTVWASGLTEEWVTKVLKGSLAMGSRGGIPLPENGSAGLLQVQPNTIAFEAMEHKERQMVALGAKIVQEATVQRTATEAGIENIAEDSILSASAKNVSQAYQWALEWACKFVGVPETGIKFELNTDFEIARMSPAERAELIKEWQAGAIAFEEMRATLRKAGVATLDDEDAKAAIDAEQQEQIELEAARVEATTPPAPNVGNGG